MKKIVLLFMSLLLTLVANVNLVSAVNNQSFTGPDVILNEDTAHIDTLNEAYEYYKSIADQLTFKDLSDPTSKGMTSTELDEIVKDDLVREAFVYTDVMEAVYYIFPSEETFADNGLKKESEIAFAFLKGELMGVSIYVRAYSMDPESIYHWKDIEEYLENGAFVQDIRLREDSILAYAYILNGGQDYNAFSYFTQDDNGDFYIENSIFQGEELDGSRYYVYRGNNAYFLEKNLFDLLYYLNPDLYSDALDDFYNQLEEDSEEGGNGESDDSMNNHSQQGPGRNGLKP